MQIKLLLCILSMLVFSNTVFSQIVYERSDYYQAGENYPIVRYTNTYDTDGLPFSNFYADGIFRIGENTDYEYCINDSIVFYEPSEFDTDGNFPEANCMYRNEMGFDVFVKIDDNQVCEIGLKGMLPFADLPYSLAANDPLNTINFPSQEGTVLDDNGNLNQKFLVTDFDAIIPPDYYDIIVALYDTVKVQVDVSLYSEFENEIQLIVQDTNEFNATRQVLSEYKREIYSMDILLRNKYSNQYASLGSIPGVGDMIPVDFPIVDTSHYINYYANDYGIPLINCKINEDRDTVYSIKAYNGDNSSIPLFSKHIEVKAFPNPSNNAINFAFEENNKGVLSIFNIEGKLITEMEFNAKNIIFDLANFESGLYVYSIKTETNKHHNGKFQVLH
jgi:hypothetical protein